MGSRGNRSSMSGLRICSGRRIRVTKRAQWKAQGFTLLLLVEGTCTITTSHERIEMRQYDRILIPRGFGGIEISPDAPAVFLECLPPAA